MVSALIAMNRPDQLRSHSALARQNGVTEEELIETITHLGSDAKQSNLSEGRNARIESGY